MKKVPRLVPVADLPEGHGEWLCDLFDIEAALALSRAALRDVEEHLDDDLETELAGDCVRGARVVLADVLRRCGTLRDRIETADRGALAAAAGLALRPTSCGRRIR